MYEALGAGGGARRAAVYDYLETVCGADVADRLSAAALAGLRPEADWPEVAAAARAVALVRLRAIRRLHPRCRRAAGLLVKRRESVISSPELSWLYRHLDQCHTCGGFAARMDAADWDLRTALGAPAVRPPIGPSPYAADPAIAPPVKPTLAGLAYASGAPVEAPPQPAAGQSFASATPGLAEPPPPPGLPPAPSVAPAPQTAAPDGPRPPGVAPQPQTAAPVWPPPPPAPAAPPPHTAPPSPAPASSSPGGIIPPIPGPPIDAPPYQEPEPGPGPAPEPEPEPTPGPEAEPAPVPAPTPEWPAAEPVTPPLEGRRKRRWSGRRTLVLLGVAIVVAAAVIVVGGGVLSDRKASRATRPTPAGTASSASAVQTRPLRTPFEADSVRWAVFEDPKRPWVTAGQQIVPAAGRVWVFVEVLVRNLGRPQFAPCALHYRVVDAAGAIYFPDPRVGAGAAPAPLAKGAQTQCRLGFQVPTQATGRRLMFDAQSTPARYEVPL